MTSTTSPLPQPAYPHTPTQQNVQRALLPPLIKLEGTQASPLPPQHQTAQQTPLNYQYNNSAIAPSSPASFAVVHAVDVKPNIKGATPSAAPVSSQRVHPAPANATINDSQRRAIVYNKLSTQRQKLLRTEISEIRRATSLTVPELPPSSSQAAPQQPLPASLDRPFTSISDAFDRLIVFHHYDTVLPSQEKNATFMQEMTSHTLLLIQKMQDLQEKYLDFIKRTSERPSAVEADVTIANLYNHYARHRVVDMSTQKGRPQTALVPASFTPATTPALSVPSSVPWRTTSPALPATEVVSSQSSSQPSPTPLSSSSATTVMSSPSSATTSRQRSPKQPKGNDTSLSQSKAHRSSSQKSQRKRKAGSNDDSDTPIARSRPNKKRRKDDSSSSSSSSEESDDGSVEDSKSDDDSNSDSDDSSDNDISNSNNNNNERNKEENDSAGESSSEDETSD